MADDVAEVDEDVVTTDEAEPVLLRRDTEGGIVGLALNRPDAFNSLSIELLEALEREIGKLADDADARVVVITGLGRAFCAGHDLKELRAQDSDGVRAIFERCSRVMLGLTRLPQPVVALVDGVATAAGCQLVAACDLALATTNARFATSGIRYGFFCSTPMVPLSRNLPRKPAMEMLLTGDFIEADEAFRLGLVNKVVPPENMEEALEETLGRLLDKPRDVLALGKRTFYRQLEMGLEDAYALTTDAMVENAKYRNFEEGMTAFAEKRKPEWS